MELRKIFEKQGGATLIKQYWKSGAFFTAVCQLMILGKSRTALEILRLSANLKTKQKIERQYAKKLEEFDEKWVKKIPIKCNKIWVCWFQGIENAPIIIQRCYQSIKDNLKDREVILITSDNMFEYVHFPQNIQRKIDAGIIKGAHLSDLIRLELLLKYGGTWIDATVYCSGSNIPSYMLDSELFLFQNLKPGRDGHATVISNWFITAYSNNKILAAVQYLIYDYWEKNDQLVDYFIFHDIFQIVIEKYYDEWNKVVPFSNATPHILLLRLFDNYNERIWTSVTEQTPFHKLSYKYDEKMTNRENTYYQAIIHK